MELLPPLVDAKYDKPTLARDLTGYGNTITIYVDPAGDDANWGEDAAHPVATLYRARDIAQMCEGTGSIDIKSDDGVYALTIPLVFTGISRSLNIVGNTSDKTAVTITTDFNGNAMQFIGLPNVSMTGVTTKRVGQATAQSSLLYALASNLRLTNINLTADVAQTGTSYGVWANMCAKIELVTNVSISNMNTAMISTAASFIDARSITGNGNNVAYRSYSLIIAYGSSLESQKPCVKTQGGMISYNGVWV